NYDPTTHKRRQLHCVAISAKRYAPFILDENCRPVLLKKVVNNKNNKWSEHGLGHLLNPTDPESNDRKWIARVWENIICRCLNLPRSPLPFESRPAVGRISVSSPAVSRAFAKYNEKKSYAEQIKPFNFLLACHVNAFGFPLGTEDAECFHLIAPYQSD